MTRAAEIVDDFLKTLEARDLDKLVDLVTDDIVYENPPADPLRGRQAMLDFLSYNYKRMTRSSCKVHYWAENERGDVVMNERTEHMYFGEQKAGATFMGVFELRDGKISAWRDYWDHQSFAEQMAAIGQKAGPGIGGSEH